jgi:hypothetical protein
VGLDPFIIRPMESIHELPGAVWLRARSFIPGAIPINQTTVLTVRRQVAATSPFPGATSTTWSHRSPWCFS